ncbi:family 78 glycoside hydrolase catalytic domain [Paenarthrobacter aromaticivorans]|uniref:family 78 glycoside hydrolase catalytic domain n=1 Tax=Paenarthrobacter aromaticivorans TaxID=2849150 RepID=UPI003A7FFD7D
MPNFAILDSATVPESNHGQPVPLLENADWITVQDHHLPAGFRPAYEFRRVVKLQRDVRRATLTVTAHGIYEAFINGRRVGDQELTPGFTSYRRTLQVQQYEVAYLLRPGVNEIRFTVSDGWYRGRTGPDRVPDGFGTEVAVIASLSILTAAGVELSITTGAGWDVAAGTIVRADLMDGQQTDLRRTGREEWRPAVISTDPLTLDRSRLTRSPAPPVRRTSAHAPVRIVRLASGRQIVDFGQNLNGWVRLSRLGPTGTAVTLTHGEALDTEGDLTLTHLDVTTPSGFLGVGQVDHVVSRGVEGDVFEPRHTTHGFRYVAVDGLAEDLTTDDLTAFLVRTDLTPIGSFISGDERINALHRIAVASWQANSCDIPTDCPQRERWGYTGDFQIFARSAAYLDDIRGFALKWLTSLADDQSPDGKVTNVAPNCGVVPNPFISTSFDGSAGWGDAATIVPWDLYRAYGERDLIERFYPMMTAWVDYAATAAATGRHPRREAAEPTPADHEEYLWDTGWHWGEWLEPGASFNPTADHTIVATAYLAHSAGIVAEVAATLGEAEDATGYAQLAARVREAWRTEFLLTDGTLARPTQANYVRALAFGLIPRDLREASAAQLVALIEENHDRLSTGFLSTGMLLPVLADHGYPEVAYRLLFQTEEPSWLAMLKRGATTVWEDWSGIGPDGTASGSLNHYSKGAFVTFLHEYVAGIRPVTPGYATFEVHPHIWPDMGSAEGRLRTEHGEIVAGWSITNDRVNVSVTVPEGTSASVYLPDDTTAKVGPGRHTWIQGVPNPTPLPRVRIQQSKDAAIAGDSPYGPWGRIDPLVDTLGDLLEDAEARATIDEIIPELPLSPQLELARSVPIGTVLAMSANMLPAELIDRLGRSLAAL